MNNSSTKTPRSFNMPPRDSVSYSSSSNQQSMRCPPQSQLADGCLLHQPASKLRHHRNSSNLIIKCNHRNSTFKPQMLRFTTMNHLIIICVTLLLVAFDQSQMILCKPNQQQQAARASDHIDKQLLRKALEPQSETNLPSNNRQQQSQQENVILAPINASAAINFQCPEQFGYYTDTKDCTKYYVCVFGEVLHESCTGGLRFSRELQTCDWPRNVDCPQLNSASNSSSTTAATTLGGQFVSAATPTLSATSSPIQSTSVSSSTTSASSSDDIDDGRSLGPKSGSNSMVFADEASDPQQPAFDEAIAPVITPDGAIHLPDGAGGTFGLPPNPSAANVRPPPSVDVFVKPLPSNRARTGAAAQSGRQVSSLKPAVNPRSGQPRPAPVRVDQPEDESDNLGDAGAGPEAVNDEDGSIGAQADREADPDANGNSADSEDDPTTTPTSNAGYVPPVLAANNDNTNNIQLNNINARQSSGSSQRQVNGGASSQLLSINNVQVNSGRLQSSFKPIIAPSSSTAALSQQQAGSTGASVVVVPKQQQSVRAGNNQRLSLSNQDDTPGSNANNERRNSFTPPNFANRQQGSAPIRQPNQLAQQANTHRQSRAGFQQQDDDNPGAPRAFAGGNRQQAAASFQFDSNGPVPVSGNSFPQFPTGRSQQAAFSQPNIDSQSTPASTTTAALSNGNPSGFSLSGNQPRRPRPPKRLQIPSGSTSSSSSHLRRPTNVFSLHDIDPSSNQPGSTTPNSRFIGSERETGDLTNSNNNNNHFGLDPANDDSSARDGNQIRGSNRNQLLSSTAVDFRQPSSTLDSADGVVDSLPQTNFGPLAPSTPPSSFIGGQSGSSSAVRSSSSSPSSTAGASSQSQRNLQRQQTARLLAPSHESATPNPVGSIHVVNKPSHQTTPTTTSISSGSSTAASTTPDQQDPQIVANRYINSAIDALEAGQPFGTVDYDFDITNDNTTTERRTPPSTSNAAFTAATITANLANGNQFQQPPDLPANQTTPAGLSNSNHRQQQVNQRNQQRLPGSSSSPQQQQHHHLYSDQQQANTIQPVQPKRQRQRQQQANRQTASNNNIEPDDGIGNQSNGINGNPDDLVDVGQVDGGNIQSTANNNQLNGASHAGSSLRNNHQHHPVALSSGNRQHQHTSSGSTTAASSGNNNRVTTQQVNSSLRQQQQVAGADSGSTFESSTVGQQQREQQREQPPTKKPRPTNKKINVNHELALANNRASTEPAKRPEALFATPQALQTATKCDNRVCRLPDCKCSDTQVPGNLDSKNIPQIVLLTFDDAVNDLNWEIYEELFTGRTNPNGCPILATFYVSHEWTDYGQVQTLYSRGHEMASHSVTHSFGEKFSKSQWFKEVNGQREILNMYGGVKMNDVRGMRAPFLQIGGNKMFEMLYDANFTYDSSMPIFENSPPMWPYTLDYAMSHECMITPCPTKSYPGVWEVGMTMWVDLRGGRCSMGDACSNPADEDGVHEMLMKNFNRHYKSNRAPFGLFYHSAWFNTVHHRRGFLKFLADVNSLPDVYFITNWQMLQWVRNPTPLSEINNFEPWQCPAKNDRPPPCFHPSVCNVKSEHGTRFMKTCQPCPANQQYPWVGATGFKSKQTGSSGNGR